MKLNYNTLIANGNKSFATLCQLTLTVSNITEFPQGTFTAKGNAWKELAKAWDSLLPFGSYGIFEEAVHRIMWSVPTSAFDPKYEDLIADVVKELLTDGDAFAAWDSNIGCKTAVSTVTSDMQPYRTDADEYNCSIEHYCYVCDKALYKIKHSKAKYASENKIYKEEISAYEGAIKKIIPAAEYWDDSHWSKESYAFDEILALYGVDYRMLPYEEYGRILLILMNSEEDIEKYVLNEAWYASNITTLPMSLAKVIWPDYTEEDMLSIFWFASEMAIMQHNAGNPYAFLKEEEIHPIGLFEKETVCQSWLYKEILSWAQIPGKLDTSVKKRIFDLSIT